MNLYLKIYKDLMNCIPHMLPFVVWWRNYFSSFLFLFEPYLDLKGELIYFLKYIGANAFNFLIPILAGYHCYEYREIDLVLCLVCRAGLWQPK